MRLPRPEDLARLAEAPGLDVLGGAVRGARDQLLRAVLRSTTPPVDGSPVDGGRGPHPLGPADLPLFDAEPLAALGQAALAAGRGESTGLDAAVSFVAGDRPGEGPAWAEPDQVACRLVHLAAIAAWSHPTADQAAALGGSARAHAAWLVRELPFDLADPDRTLALSALLIAGLAWPALPEAATWRASALGSLGPAAMALVGQDGAPAACEPQQAARALWALALARAWAAPSDAALPAQAIGALVQGGVALARLAGDSPSLPGLPGATPALLPLSAAPTWARLYDLLVAWGLDRGSPATAAADPGVQRLARRVPAGAPQPAATDLDWILYSWRGAGVAAAHNRIKHHPSRLLFRQHDGLVQWQLDGQTLVTGHRSPLRLTVARTDGPKARIIAVPPGSDAFADDRPERDILLRQARVVVADRGVDRIQWTLGPGWSLVENDKGEWLGEQGDWTLVVKLDHEGWSWSVQGDRIEGQGDPSVTVRSMFELR